ncbi:hypothetical protein PHLH4_20240 [Pseudomonas sp. St316]|nr:hypothetical protein PHLH4_20240 [Pseudomonas sp. St316]
MFKITPNPPKTIPKNSTKPPTAPLPFTSIPNLKNPIHRRANCSPL